MRPRTLRIVGLLLSAGLCVIARPALAQDDDAPGEVLRNAQIVKQLTATRAKRLGVSAGPDPDTVNVGTNAFWDWDNTVGIQAPDSLHGWWPTHRQYVSTGGLTLTDDQRPWWALDHGNLGNYVISQQSSAKRTFGVVSYWHGDPGNNAGSAMMWSPINGTRSAWCGLREHGDVSVVDQVTGQPYNQDCVFFLHDATFAGGGSPQRFPGYVDQADQMMYRDIAMTPAQSLTVSFNYRTRMSTSIGSTATTRTGWFHSDPR